jgi:L-asparaginase/Glu-tRNA(Gln) amidotransferase subunit D
MLENLGKTVVFTGSQIPFAEVYNDARRNLIVSIIFASLQEFPEVCIFFNDRLLRGNRCSKVNR